VCDLLKKPLVLRRGEARFMEKLNAAMLKSPKHKKNSKKIRKT
jgi:hypothetical protein